MSTPTQEKNYHLITAVEMVTILERRNAELRAALMKIDAVRNSIVGRQSVNWSEHIYPLVAALNEAGFGSEGYAAARAKAETEAATRQAVVDERDALLAEVTRLRASPALDRAELMRGHMLQAIAEYAKSQAVLEESIPTYLRTQAMARRRLERAATAEDLFDLLSDLPLPGEPEAKLEEALPPGVPAIARGGACDHGVTFDLEAAKDLPVTEIRRRWPRGFGLCPKNCGWSGICYASKEHFIAGDW